MIFAFVTAVAATVVVLGLGIALLGPWLTLAIAALVAVSYVGFLRSWILTWGATPAEANGTLPGDALVPRGRNVTRAIDCGAPARAVWPWLVQMGQGRAGFYSYQTLENIAGLRIRNADRILPEWQRLEVGDLVPFTPDGFGMRVLKLDPERTLVLAASVPTPGDGELEESTVAWSFHLSEDASGHARLLVRLRTPDALRPPVSWGAAAFLLLVLEPLHFVMEQRMMRGIRQRAERLTADAPRLA